MAIFKKAEAYAKEYKEADAKELRLARDARKHGNFYVPSEAKLAIVMRIRGINGLHPRVRKVRKIVYLYSLVCHRCLMFHLMDEQYSGL